MEIFSLYRQVLTTSEKTTVCNRAYNAPKTFFILLMLSVFHSVLRGLYYLYLLSSKLELMLRIIRH